MAASNPLTLPGDGLGLVADSWEPKVPRDRPPIVFLHGGGQTRHSWDSTARLLSEDGWQCYTVDLRGHGDSDWSPDATYSIDAHARDVISFSGALGITPIIVGASMGGLAGLEAIAAQPELAQALVLVDIVPRTSPAGVKRISDFMTGHLDGFGSLDEVADAVAEYTGRTRRTNTEGLKKNVRLRGERWYWHWDPKMVRPDAQGEGRVPDADRLLEQARKVHVPTLVVRGGQSDVVDAAGVDELLGVLPRGHQGVVDNARHMVAGDDNMSFAAAVSRFLNDIVLTQIPTKPIPTP